MKYTAIFALTIIFFISCISHRGIISLHDTRYFKEHPKIVIFKDAYFLRFCYADKDSNFHFFMTSDSKILQNEVIFYIPATSSSGKMDGRIQYERIVTKDKIALIEKSSAFWEEPDGTLIPLRIERHDSIQKINPLENIH